MKFILRPWQLLAFITAGLINRQQQQTIEYLTTENQVLKEKLGKKRILLSDDQRRRLAVKGKVLGRKLLMEISTIVTPDTIMRWHRQLVANKWDYNGCRKKKPGRPPVPEEVTRLVLHLAQSNPTWGYDRIQGALANLGHEISDTTVGNNLKAHGIEPAPERKRQTTWKTFLKAHWDVLGAPAIRGPYRDPGVSIGREESGEINGVAGDGRQGVPFGNHQLSAYSERQVNDPVAPLLRFRRSPYDNEALCNGSGQPTLRNEE